MKILVTGCNGLLGQKLIALLSKLPEVRLVATARQPLAGGWVVPFEIMDITDSAVVERVVSSNAPDVIIHAAAMTQVDVCEQSKEACFLTNVVGVENIITAARRCGAHLIHISTDFVFDGQREMLREEDAPNPVNYYGQCKWLAEQAVMAGDVPFTIVRTVLVYGILRSVVRSNILTWVKENLEHGKRIRVVSDQWRTPTLAEDLAYGCYLIASKNAVGLYHLSGKDYVSVYDIALRTAAFFGLDATLIEPIASASLQQPARRPPRTGFNIEKARRELGYQPHSLHDGIALVAAQLAHRT